MALYDSYFYFLLFQTEKDYNSKQFTTIPIISKFCKMKDNYHQECVEAMYGLIIKYENNIKDAEFYIKFQKFYYDYLEKNHLKLYKKSGRIPKKKRKENEEDELSSNFNKRCKIRR